MDAKVPGLGIAIYPSGTKTFFYRRKKGAIDTGRIPLGNWIDGDFPDMTITQAREKATEFNAEVNSGTNPGQARKVARGEVTWGQFFAVYLEDHAKIHKKTWRSDQSQYDLYMEDWEGRQISSIEKPDVVALFSDIVAAGSAHTANRVLAQIRVMFRLAEEWGYHPGPNPAAGIKKKSMPARDRKIRAGEFPDFLRALFNYPHQTMQDLIACIMFTGMRSGKVCAMRWDDIDMDGGIWEIEEAKHGDGTELPLADVVVEILGDRYRMREIMMASPKYKPSRKDQWVFPGRSKAGHIVQISRAWLKICTAAGFATTGPNRLRPHDLRRTLGSIQANNGVNLAITSRTLAHKNIETTRRVYTVIDHDPMREAVNMAAAKIIEFRKTGTDEGASDG